MSHPLKILFAIDFKEGCEHAAGDILDFARNHEIELTLIHSFDESFFAEKSELYPEAALKLESIQEELRGKLENQLDTWAKKNFPSIKLTTEIAFGKTADIVRERSKKYDWIVLGVNRHNLVERFFSASTAEEILGRTFAPTVVLKQKFSGSDQATVLLDLGDHPNQLIDYSLKWAKRIGLKKLNYHIYYPMPLEVSAFVTQASVFYGGTDFEGLLGDLMESTKKQISQKSEDIDVTVRVKKVRAASVSSDIAYDMAEAEHPVVVGRRQRSKLSELFLGSVTTALLRSCPADLVILPIRERD